MEVDHRYTKLEMACLRAMEEEMTTTSQVRQDFTCNICEKHLRGEIARTMHLKAKHLAVFEAFLDTIFVRTGYTNDF